MKLFLTLLIFGLIIGILGAASAFAWWQENLKALDRAQKDTQIFVVQKGESLKAIALDLEEKKLIRSWFAFSLLVRKEGWQNKIQAGDFRLSPSFSATKIAEELQHGTLDVWVTIPEGWRSEEVVEELLKSGIWNEFQSQSVGFKKQALDLFNKNNGKLFPDTYLIPKGSTTEQVLEIFLRNFRQKITGKWWEEAAKQDISPDQVLVLASLVEREAKYENDRPIVADIIRKRWQEKIPLQIDATVQYALGESTKSQGGSWWKKELTGDDLKIDSTYNTYLYPGLPSGPICNPGLSAIKAVIFSTKTPYYYYLSDKSGKMHYAKTLEEHNENIRKYF
ncbi:endolytic transglycosylase MltG [Candidatus Gottesmanbacteria bacterium]|nr:endolytic transglycosylase MltG [Candidatus Gottesmanbacteria bacterium]